MAVIYIDGFEHRSVVTGTGGIYSASSGTPTIDTTTYRTGAAALRLNPSSGTEYLTWTPATAPSALALSFYARFATLPGDQDVFLLATVTTSRSFGIGYDTNIGGVPRFYLRISSGMSSDVAFGPSSPATNTWYRFDIKADWSTGTMTISAMVDGANEASDSSVVSAGTLASLTWGDTAASQTYDMYLDDVVATNSTADYPIGPHTVEGLRLTGDGTHSVGSGSFIGRADGTGLTNSTTDAYTRLDETDIASTTTYIEQQGSDATAYMECTFADLAAGTDLPQGIFAHNIVEDESGTGSSPAFSRVVLSDGTSVSPDLRLTTDDPGLTWTMKNKILTAPGGGWTRTNVNGLKFRFGGGDGNPDTYTGSAIIEVWMNPAPTNITGVVLTVSPSLPAGSLTTKLTGVVLTQTPSLPAGVLKTDLTGVVLTVSPSLPAGTLTHQLPGAALTASPSFPAGALAVDIFGVVLTTTPSLPAGDAGHALLGVVLTVSPTLPAGEVVADAGQSVTGVALEVTPALPAAVLSTAITGVVLSTSPTQPAGVLNTGVVGVVLTITPAFPAAQLDWSITAVVLSVTPALPTGAVQADHIATGVVLSIAPSQPAGVLTYSVTGQVVTILPELPSGALSTSLTGVVLEATPSLPAGEVQQTATALGVVLTVTPEMPTGALVTAIIGIVLTASPGLPAGELAAWGEAISRIVKYYAAVDSLVRYYQATPSVGTSGHSALASITKRHEAVGTADLNYQAAGGATHV